MMVLYCFPGTRMPRRRVSERLDRTGHSAVDETLCSEVDASLCMTVLLKVLLGEGSDVQGCLLDEQVFIWVEFCEVEGIPWRRILAEIFSNMMLVEHGREI